jgi:hypothetical protein
MPGESKKPPNHGTYQIWHEAKTHVVDVESVGLREVWRLTKGSPERWKDKPGVTIHAEGPRATRVGDVIVDPELDAWEVQEAGFMHTTPPAQVAEFIARGGIESPTLRRVRAWVRDCLEANDAHEEAHAEPGSSRGEGPP